MMGFLKDLYSWVSLQPMFVKLGMMILLTAAGLYVLGYIMSIFFGSSSERLKIQVQDIR